MEKTVYELNKIQPSPNGKSIKKSETVERIILIAQDLLDKLNMAQKPQEQGQEKCQNQQIHSKISTKK
jgi:hypothetical protein